MKFIIITCFNLILFPFFLLGQGENNLWNYIGKGGNTECIDFNTAVPSIIDVLPQVPSYNSYGIPVCFPNGQLRFVVRLKMSTFVDEPNIYVANGTPVSNSNFRTGSINGVMPIVIPKPGNSDQYFIFYGYGNSLLYSLLDMGLNGGNGAIVTGHKDVVLGNHGTVIPSIMTSIVGCDGVWLVVRSSIDKLNQYYSYHVTKEGIDPIAVVSEAGRFEIHQYSLGVGKIKGSPNGKKLAFIGWMGAEIYDFEKCSGKLKNAQVLDTTGNSPLVGQITPIQIGNRAKFAGVCFSPDNSKLYISQNWIDSVVFVNTYCHPGKLYQYDISRPTIEAIISSKNLIITNQSSIGKHPIIIDLRCIYVNGNTLGDIKSAPNGKLYVDNGCYTCLAPSVVPPGYNPSPGFHVINQPNLPGLSCNPQLNSIIVNTNPNNYSDINFECFRTASSWLPNDIVLASPPPDTIIGKSLSLVNCFKDSFLLTASEGECYEWDNGIKERIRWATSSGSFYVSYYKDCSFTTDTFHLEFVKMPKLNVLSNNCPGMQMGVLSAELLGSDNKLYTFLWKDARNNVLKRTTHIGSDTLTGLSDGSYSLNITTNECDTTIYAQIENYPKPELTVSSSKTTIPYGDSIQLKVSGALLYTWWPSDPLTSSTDADPIATLFKPTLFKVIGINKFGCADTGYIKIEIDYTMPDMIPNAFSPNGDGINDLFKVEGIRHQKVEQFSVFNRYGQQVFSTVDGSKGWNGNYNGKPCDAGSYYYQIQISYPDGQIKTCKGDLILVK